MAGWEQPLRSVGDGRRGGGPGEDPSSPGIPAAWIAPRAVVQVGHRCPAVKVERPQRSEDERP
jgi:hypothetical protein